MNTSTKPVDLRHPLTQRLLPDLERSRRMRRRFKLAIVCLTALALAAMVGGTRAGRYGLALVADRVKWRTQALIGMSPSRADIDAEWRLKRSLGVEQTDRTYRTYYKQDATPAWRRILKAAGMAPGDALLRWANYDWTVVLSSKVFEADETGRAYRMTPNRRAFWSRNHALTRGISSFFFLPDTPEVRLAMDEANEPAMPDSFQSTNSWGCRSPEPDLQARARGLIIGDSFMQGLFVADDQTPPECLARELREAWKIPVSILNTGHIGYSPEQYYFTLLEYFGRFRPHFVILSVCPNDFGDASSVLNGRADWDEGKYWIGEIQQFCRTKQVPCLLVPVPVESQVVGHRNQGHYPGQVSSFSDPSSTSYFNPVELFAEESLRLRRESTRLGTSPRTSPLYNGHLEDGHFSRLGTALWGKHVARRIGLIMDPPAPPEAEQGR